MNDTRLTPFIAALLPGDVHWPAADTLDLDLSSPASSAGAEALRVVADLPTNDPVSTLMQLEQNNPMTFASFQVLVYGAYYSHPDVLDVIEQRCGYPARAPQPVGHVIPLAGPDPNPSCLGGQPRWRADGTTIAESVFAAQAAEPDRIWTTKEIELWRQ